jgi:hypothetical protein
MHASHAIIRNGRYCSRAEFPLFTQVALPARWCEWCECTRTTEARSFITPAVYPVFIEGKLAQHVMDAEDLCSL